MPRVLLTRRRAIAFALFVLSALGFLYFVLPKLAGVTMTLHRLERGDTWWIIVGGQWRPIEHPRRALLRSGWGAVVVMLDA